jgi:hypothetical protein
MKKQRPALKRRATRGKAGQPAWNALFGPVYRAYLL